MRGTAHLQVRVAEYHKLGAGIDVVPFDEGEVHSTNSLQAREVRTRLPVLSVLLHYLLSQTGLLTAQRAAVVADSVTHWANPLRYVYISNIAKSQQQSYYFF